MATPTWTFAPNGNGEDKGFHDPGIETFKEDVEGSLAREALQNSIDARNDKRKPVRVSFSLITLDRDDVPGLADLSDAFLRVMQYWPHDKQAKDFLVRARHLAAAHQMNCLLVADSNTTGVPGTDIERELGWYNLVRSSGHSAKAAGSGGSYGLGKHAPFAASQMRSVFYSTRTDDGTSAFQGVTRLATHEGPEGRRQAVGFLGGPGGRSIRNKKDIPAAFRRDDAGTNVYVLGYPAAGDWEEEVLYSVLKSFWPAIHRGDLIVTVGETTVAKTNLPALLGQFSTGKDFDAHLYYRAYTDTDPKTNQTHTLPTLGDVHTYFVSGDPNFPNHVAMVRATGMVVYHRRGRGSRVPYCGVFECRNEQGNEMLRNMEPPRHDDWNGDLPEKYANRKAKKELDELIIERIKALAPASTEKTISIPDLSQYLPDDGDTPDDAFDGPVADGVGQSESFNRTAKTQAISGRNLGRKQATHPSEGTAGEGDGASGDDDGDEGGDPNDGTGGNKGSKGGGQDGTDGGSGGRTPIAVRSRAFLTDAATGDYSLIVHPPSPRPTSEVLLAIAAVGDDAFAVPVRMRSARLPGGRRLDVPSLGRVGPVAFPKTGPLRIEATLAEPRRLSLQVTAEEVSANAAE